MLIKEVEELLQMSSYTLRYYEKMGLIHPKRDENGYRNYTQEDIHLLKKIRFLRELEIPIESIIEMNNQTMDFQDILDEHLEKLHTKIQSLKYLQDVCLELKEKDIPLLDAIIDEQIIKEEQINKTEIKEGLKKIVQYLKPMKTVVIGTRVEPRTYISAYIMIIMLSIFGGLIVGVGVPRFIELMKMSDYFHISIWNNSILFVMGTIICFIICILVFSSFYSKQRYIELTDSGVSICSIEYQSHWSMFKGMITKNSKALNKNYQYKDIQSVHIQLFFTTVSGGYSGLWNTYVLTYTFNFLDGEKWSIDAGSSCGENIKDAYRILKEKQVKIVADEIIETYFEQDEKNYFDFFEEEYHLNSKK